MSLLVLMLAQGTPATGSWRSLQLWAAAKLLPEHLPCKCSS